MSGIEQGFLLLVDGLDWAFWTREDMATGTGAVSGISRTNDFVGLQIPQTAMAVDVKTGDIQPSPARFELHDVSDSLAALFASTLEDPDPPNVPYTIPGETAYDSSIFGKQAGVEAVGPAGERGRHPAVQSYQLGSFHPGNEQLAAEGRGQVYASDAPYIFAGRRVVLYRFERSGDDWGSYSNARRVWWGTLRDGGTVSGRKWQLSADGPDSWLRRTLNANSFQQPLGINPLVSLRTDQTRVGFRGMLIRYEYSSANGYIPCGPTLHCNWQEPDASSQVGAFLGYTPQQFRDWWRFTLMPAIFSGTGTGAAPGTTVQSWTGTTGTLPIASSYSVPDDGSLGITLTEATTFGGGWCGDMASPGYGRGLFQIVLHEKVWKVLGWSPEEQHGISREDTAGVTFRAMTQATSVGFIPGGGSFNDWPPGYWMGTFLTATRPYQYGQTVEAAENPLTLGGGPDAKQETRMHSPLYGGSQGVGILGADPEATGGQQIPIVNFDDSVYVQPQLDAPPAKDPGGDDATPYPGPVSAQGLFAFTGQWRAIGTDEAEARTQVGRCSWEQAGTGADRNRIEVDPTDYASTIVLSKWHAPRAFNVDDEMLQGDWLGLVDGGESALKVQPLANFGSQDGITRADRLLLSLLVSSGSSGGWFTDPGYSVPGYGGAQNIEPGDNNKSSAFALGQFVTDRNGADFGLGIPAEMVADVFDWEALAFDVPAALRRVTVAHAGPVNGDAITRGIMAPLGWCWSLRGGKYGAFKPSDDDAQPAEDAELDGESIAGNLGRGSSIPNQNIRYRTALDAVDLKLRRDPLTGAYKFEERIKSADAGALYRAGDSVLTLDAPYVTGEGTVEDVRRHWAPIFKWLARRHFLVSGLRVLQSVGLNLWPGSRVRITHPWLVSQLGAYGVTSARGIVLSVSQDWAGGATTIDLLVTQPPGQGERIAAPEASAYAYVPGAPAIYCDTDFRGISGGHNDLTAFARPSWASGTGDADIIVRQYARGQLVQVLEGTVTAVDLEAGRLDLAAPVIGGDWLRDCDSIITVREFSTQGATWPALTFAPIADETGQVAGTADNAVKWSDI